MDTQKVKFNESKFKSAILFLLSLDNNKTIEGKKKLAKLLYFADFNYFEVYEEPITGAKYRALPMGPVPDELEKALKDLGKTFVTIKHKRTGLPNDTVVFSLNITEKKVDSLNLNEKEKQVLRKVYKDYGGMSGKNLEIISHSEAPYNAVTQGEYMPYELSFYRDKTSEELIGA